MSCYLLLADVVYSKNSLREERQWFINSVFYVLVTSDDEERIRYMKVLMETNGRTGFSGSNIFMNVLRRLYHILKRADFNCVWAGLIQHCDSTINSNKH